MKNKIALAAIVALASMPALAAAAVNHPAAWPPGPSIWAFIAFLLGGCAARPIAGVGRVLPAGSGIRTWPSKMLWRERAAAMRPSLGRAQ
jgi:hypothetical protein